MHIEQLTSPSGIAGVSGGKGTLVISGGATSYSAGGIPSLRTLNCGQLYLSL